MKKLTKIDLGFFAWLTIVMTIAILTSSCSPKMSASQKQAHKWRFAPTCETYK